MAEDRKGSNGVSTLLLSALLTDVRAAGAGKAAGAAASAQQSVHMQRGAATINVRTPFLSSARLSDG
jgi:hypothetical protein